MKTQTGKVLTTTLVVVLILFVNGCQEFTVEETTGVSPNPTATKPNVVNSPPVETTVAATVTPLPTKTARPTNTLAPTPTITWTPIPTLGEQKSQELIQRLLVDNGGCELPCVWGLTPGQTTWPEAQQFLQSFTQSKSQAYSTYFKGIVFSFAYPIQGYGDLDYIGGVVKNNYVIEFSLGPPGTQKRYRLDQVLARYGQPGEVYIGTGSSLPYNFIPFDMILYYPELGFSALYEYRANYRGSQVIVCPTAQPIGPNLDIWDPKVEISITDIIQSYYGDPGIPMLTVQEALGMEMEQFTRTFKDENTASCFFTPVDLWR